MKKDGTAYLALVQHPNGTQTWNVVRWAKPAAFSDPFQKECWVSGFMGLRVAKILEYYDLQETTDVMRWLTNTNEAIRLNIK